jgi:hypothetical protein
MGLITMVIGDWRIGDALVIDDWRLAIGDWKFLVERSQALDLGFGFN